MSITTLKHFENNYETRIVWLLLVLRNKVGKLRQIRTHHLSDFLSILEEFKSRHGLNFLVRRDILGFVHIDLGKNDTCVLFLGGQFLKLGRNELAGTA